ncbi:MAG: flagellar basal body rod protein FlgB [Azoarcus sp.]|jgi:flagellar basal-body rod protein FlgB|nr:flagellar basal body rod protein FlgB [Azoarcus sp.]
MKTLLERDLLVHQSALNLQAYRQELLASNIANADTPNYKARDVQFREALDAAVGRRWGGPLALATTHSSHLEGKTSLSPEAFVRYRTEQQSSVDGNTVSLDVERAAFAENTVHYEASITFINGLLRSMQMAITGQQ